MKILIKKSTMWLWSRGYIRGVTVIRMFNIFGLRSV